MTVRMFGNNGLKPPSNRLSVRDVSWLHSAWDQQPEGVHQNVALASFHALVRIESELVCRREADRPNAICQADHSLLDILLRCDTEKPLKNVKPWLTIIIDDHSRAIAGYYLSF
jgi:hypothetical protein